MRAVLGALTICVMGVNAAMLAVAVGWLDEPASTPPVAVASPGQTPAHSPSRAPDASAGASPAPSVTPPPVPGELTVIANGTPALVEVAWTGGPTEATRLEWTCPTEGYPCTASAAVPADVEVRLRATHRLVGLYPFLLRIDGACRADVDPREAIRALAIGGSGAEEPGLGEGATCTFPMPAAGATIELGYGFVHWGAVPVSEPPYVDVEFCGIVPYPGAVPSPVPPCPPATPTASPSTIPSATPSESPS